LPKLILLRIAIMIEGAQEHHPENLP